MQEKTIIKIKRLLIDKVGPKSFETISEYIPQITKLVITIDGNIYVTYKGEQLRLEKLSFSQVYLIAHYLIAYFVTPKVIIKELQTLHLSYNRQVQCLVARVLSIKNINEIITYSPNNQVHISNVVTNGSVYSFLYGSTNNIFVGVISRDGNIDYTYMGHFCEFDINNMIDVLATTF